MALALESQNVVISSGIGFRLTAVVTLVVGTIFLMWLGEQVTERGVGNGISMVIFAGIVAGNILYIGDLVQKTEQEMPNF